MRPLRFYVLARVDEQDAARGARSVFFLRPHHLGRRETFVRASATVHLDQAFIFPSEAHARIALEAIGEQPGSHGWIDSFSVVELGAAIGDAEEWTTPPATIAIARALYAHGAELSSSSVRYVRPEGDLTDPGLDCDEDPALAIMLEHARAARIARGEPVLDNASIVRTDGDASTDCTWGAWKRANAAIDPSEIVALELELVRSGRHEEPAGGSAGWTLELVRKIEPGVIVACPACGGGAFGREDRVCPVCDPEQE